MSFGDSMKTERKVVLKGRGVVSRNNDRIFAHGKWLGLVRAGGRWVQANPEQHARAIHWIEIER